MEAIEHLYAPKKWEAEARGVQQQLPDKGRYRAITDELSEDEAAQFTWKATTGSIQTYRHDDTGRNLHIDQKTGQFFTQDGRTTSREVAVDRAVNHSVEEDGRRYQPVDDALTPREAEQFLWEQETGTIQSYTNTVTHRVLHVDASGQFYNKEGAPITKEAALESTMPYDPRARMIDQTPRHWTKVDYEAHYRALRENLTPDEAQLFRWAGNDRSVETYENIETGRIIHIDSQTGRFYDRYVQPTTREDALARAMPSNAYNEPPRKLPPENASLQLPYTAQQIQQGKELPQVGANIGEFGTGDFVWKQRSGTIESYQHIESGKHIHLDEQGQFYNQDREPIGREAALNRVLDVPAVQEQAHSTAAPQSIQADRPQVATFEQSIGL